MKKTSTKKQQKTDSLKHVLIYTDGACTGNPGPGGYAAILLYGDNRKEISAGYRKTTNNRMELMAAIAGLEALKMPCRVTLYSDSRYLVDSITKGWVYQWQTKGWMRNKHEPALNSDLWERLLPLLEKHQVEIVWVRGHADTPENIRADELAVQAIKSKNLLVDQNYEANSESNSST
ncbi:MAG: hypothetical protein Kow0042_31550 [Calditrichia bacterium]